MNESPLSDEEIINIISMNRLLTDEEAHNVNFVSNLYSVLSSIIFDEKREINRFVDFTFTFLTSPIDRNMVFSEIFLFLISLLEANKVSKVKIIDKIFDSMSSDDISYLIETYPQYKSLFNTSIDESFFTKEHIAKIIEIASIKKRNDIQIDYFAKIIGMYMNSSIFRILLSRLDTTAVECFFVTIMMDNYFLFPTLFQESFCFDIVLERINDESFLNSFVYFWGSLNQYTHCYFIDDWLLDQPSSLPIFKIPSNLIYIYGPNNEAILQPSLLPLKKTNIKLTEFNLYLMGRYSVPIYIKLGFKYSEIPYIDKISNYFISPFDVLNMVTSETNLVFQIINTTTNTSIFQLMNDITPAKIEINQNCQSFSMFIKFCTLFPSQYPFLTINNKKFSVEKDYILDERGNKLIQIPEDHWISLIFIGRKNTQKISIFVNGKLMISYNDDQIPFLVQQIGNRYIHPPLKLQVASNIICDEDIWSDEEIQIISEEMTSKPPNFPIKMSRSVVCSTYLPIIQTLSDTDFISKLFLKFDEFNSDILSGILPQIAILPSTDLFFLFNNFIFLMFNSKTKPSESFIKFYINCVFSLQQNDVKSKLIANFILSPFLLNLDDKTLSGTLSSLYCLLRNNIKSLDFGVICNKKIIFVLFLFLFICNTHLIAVYQIFTLFIANNNTDFDLINEIADLILISSNFKPFLTENETNEDKTLEIQQNLLNSIIDKLNLVNFKKLMEFSVLLSKDVSYSLYKHIFERSTKEKQFLFIDLIVFYTTKFSSKSDIWESLFSTITKSNFSFLNYKEKNLEIRDDFLVPVLLEMIVSISEKETEFERKIIDVSKPLLMKNIWLLMENRFIPYLVDLFSEKYQKKSYFFNQFVSDIFSEFFVKNKNIEDNTFNAVLIKYGTNDILSYTISKIFVKLTNKNFNENFSNSIKIFLMAAQKRNKEITKTANFFENMVMMIQSRPSLVFDFAFFFAYNIEMISPETLELILKMMSKNFSNKGNVPLFLSFFFMVLMNSNLAELKLPFMRNFYDSLKSFAQKNNFSVFTSLLASNDFTSLVYSEEEKSRINKFVENYEKTSKEVLESYEIKQEQNRENLKIENVLKEAEEIQEMFHREFFVNLDTKLRECESLECKLKISRDIYHSQNLTKEELEKETKSFHISPFFSPKSSPSLIIPSKQILQTPNLVHSKKQNLEENQSQGIRDNNDEESNIIKQDENNKDFDQEKLNLENNNKNQNKEKSISKDENRKEIEVILNQQGENNEERKDIVQVITQDENSQEIGEKLELQDEFEIIQISQDEINENLTVNLNPQDKNRKEIVQNIHNEENKVIQNTQEEINKEMKVKTTNENPITEETKVTPNLQDKNNRKEMQENPINEEMKVIKNLQDKNNRKEMQENPITEEMKVIKNSQDKNNRKEMQENPINEEMKVIKNSQDKTTNGNTITEENKVIQNKDNKEIGLNPNPQDKITEETKVTQNIQNRNPINYDKFSVKNKFYPLISKESSIYSVSYSNDIKSQIEMIYNPKCFMNTKLIRLFTRIPCVSFIHNGILMILSNSKYENDEIKFIEEENQQFLYFLSRVEEGDYGNNYTMFLGHPLISISDVAFCYEYFGNSSEIYSALNGVFIVEFEGEYSLVHGIKRKGLETDQNLWTQGEMSNLKYILSVNHFAKRSFVDCSNYPIFPRLIKDLSLKNQNKTEENEDDFIILDEDKLEEEIEVFGFKLRNLSLPIEIACGTKKEKEIIMNRFDVQGFHFTENISNSSFVSSLLLRYSPFCNIQWDIFNGNWDTPERIFIDVSKHLSCSQRVNHEMIPEMFYFPEIFMNLNNFSFENGKEIVSQFPDWASSPYSFVTIMREILNSDEVRTNLNNWFDIVFGFKLNNSKFLNTFHPNSIHCEEDDNEEKKEWRFIYGEVPQQIFNSSHPKSSFGFVGNIMTFDVDFEYDPVSSIISIGNISVATGLSFARHVSTDGKTISLTSRDGIVFLYTFPSLKFLNKFSRKGCYMSKVCTECFLCVSVFNGFVVFWFISNARIINIINIDFVNNIEILKENHFVLIHSGEKILTFSPSGFPVY